MDPDPTDRLIRREAGQRVIVVLAVGDDVRLLSRAPRSKARSASIWLVAEWSG